MFAAADALGCLVILSGHVIAWVQPVVPLTVEYIAEPRFVQINQDIDCAAHEAHLDLITTVTHHDPAQEPRALAGQSRMGWSALQLATRLLMSSRAVSYSSD